VHRTLAALALLALAIPVIARAQADSVPKRWKLDADLGLVSTAGNTDVTTINVKEGFTWRDDGWGVTQTFQLVYSENEGEVGANLWQAAVRGERRIGGLWRLYGLLSFTRNPFAGVDRRFEETAGVLVRPVDTARDSLEFDLGASLAQQWVPDTSLRIDFASARLAMGYRHFFRQKAYVVATATILPNLQFAEDVRVWADVAVGAPLTNHLGLKVGYSIVYDNVPDGDDALRVLDRYLTAAVQVRF
jgi:putative salt-induced outer membrane protein YdiY